jgi:hypothetical protein
MRAAISSMRAELNDLKAFANPPEEPHIVFDGLKFKLNHANATEYDPCSNSVCETFESFHKDRSKVRLLMGGFGSAKSTTCCAEVVLQLYNMPPMLDGVRRAKGIIVRNTMGEIESTTMKTWAKWFGNDQLGVYLGKQTIRRKPNLIYNYTYYDNRGKCELELFCIGLDSEKAKAKLESVEATFAYVNEAQHIPRGVIVHLIGRVGRYPAKDDMTAPFFSYVIADTNPPPVTHWMHKDFDSKNKIEGNRIFHQPHGLIKNHNGEWINNPKCDNVKHLPDNYYYDMARAEGFSESYIKTICNGEYGFSKEGKPVYSEYNDDIHSVDNLDILEDLPIVIAVDGGSTPAALVTQCTEEGQMMCCKEFTTHFSSARTLKENHVLPWVIKHLKEDQEVLLVCDPSMSKSNENIEVSAMQIWEDPRWEVITAKSNLIDPRVEAQKDFLNKMVEGKPKFLLSRIGCPVLRESMISKYCYVEIAGKNEGTFRDVPDKTHPYSDIADCGQYAALEYVGDGIRIIESDIDLDEFTEASLTSGWV